MSDVETELVRRRGAEPLVVATVVRANGDPPSRPGEKVLVGGGRPLAGTLGCSEFDSAAVADAPAVLAGAAPQLRTYTHDLGTIEVYLEPHLPPPALVVLGHTPVAHHLLRWAAEVGFRAVADVKEAGEGDVYAVHTDHDAPGLVDQLDALLRRSPPPRFVGVMGSARHTSHHLKELRDRGLDTALIRTPVGLDIGARGPGEIALSILAGVVAARNGGGGGWKDANQ